VPNAQVGLRQLAWVWESTWNVFFFLFDERVCVCVFACVYIYMYVSTLAVFTHTRRGHHIPLQMAVSHHVVAGI